MKEPRINTAMAESPVIGEIGRSHFRRTKRSHKKSRAGCFTCKRRRVKCDEERPSCNTCRSRELTCAYVDGSADNLRALHGSPSSASKEYRSPSHNTVIATQSQCLAGVHDAELAQHYLRCTMHSFARTSRRKEQADVWRIVVPALAYVSPVVRQGMMVLAAICCHFHQIDSSEQSLKYRQAAEARGEIFVENSRRQLQQLQQSEIDSTLACSRLLCVLGFAFYRIHRSSGISIADESGWRWLHLLRGVPTLHLAAIDSGQSIHPTLAQNMIPEIPLSSYNIDFSYTTYELCRSHPLFNMIDESRQERFAALCTAVNERKHYSNKQLYEDLLSAIGTLHKVTEHICTGEVHSLFRAICTWPANIPKGFLQILTDCHPMALVVYAHWLMLVILIEDLWWIDDMGRADIREVVAMCSKSDPDIQGLMEWPRRSLHFGSSGIEFSCDV